MGNAGAVFSPQAPAADPTPQPSARVRRHLKNYLIDKKLQLRYVLFVTILSAIISGVLGWLLYQQETRASSFILEAVRDDKELGPWLGEQLKGQDRSQLTVMLAVGIGLIAVLSMYLIVMTHKVAGPLHKMGLYFDRIRDGKLPEVHALRKGDQLQDVFGKFRDMDEALRDRTKAEIELLGRFLAECEKAGVSSAGELGHRLDELKRLVKEKEVSLS